MWTGCGVPFGHPRHRYSRFVVKYRGNLRIYRSYDRRLASSRRPWTRLTVICQLLRWLLPYWSSSRTKVEQGALFEAESLKSQHLEAILAEVLGGLRDHSSFLRSSQEMFRYEVD